MFIVTATLRERHVQAIVSLEEKNIIEENNGIFEFVLRDWYGYGCDYWLTGNEFTFIEIPPKDYEVLERYSGYLEHNEEAIHDYLRALCESNRVKGD